MPLSIYRKPGQSIVLAHPSLPRDILVRLSEIAPDGDKAYMGIIAPRSVLIARAEALPDVSPAQIEEHLGPFTKVDREAAKLRIFPQTRAYIERLEAIAKLADTFWQSTQTMVMTPEQYELSEQLYQALEQVEFLDEEALSHVG